MGIVSMRPISLRYLFLTALAFSAATGQKWRDDRRCGSRFPLDDGSPAECDPDSRNPCCSAFGRCNQKPTSCANMDYRTPVNGGWSYWSPWGACSAKCDGGTRSRTRTCTDPAPKHGGEDCVGDEIETEECNTFSCAVAVDGGYSQFGEWSECSAKCGGGVQTSTRVCDNPAPQNGGKDCEGDDTETRPCNSDPCGPDIGCWPLVDRKAKGTKYTGEQSTTIGGHTCQMWNETTPHSHGYTIAKYGDKGIGEHNFCRNPYSKYSRVWCYTTNPDVRWDYCYVPTCEIDEGCWPKLDRAKKGSGYRGEQSLTRNGYTCKDWTLTSYGTEKYKNEGIGEHNYCRNPAEKYSDVWCYTVDGSRWDWCDVPTCGGCDCDRVNDQEFELTNMEYDLKEGKIVEMPPSTAGEKIVYNSGGSLPQSVKFSVSRTETEERSFTHTRGSTVTIGARFSVGFPFIAGAGIEYSKTTTSEFTAGEKSTKSKEVTSEFTCNGAPKKTTKCTALQHRDKLSVPYKSTWTYKYDDSCVCTEEGVYEVEATNRMSMTVDEE